LRTFRWGSSEGKEPEGKEPPENRREVYSKKCANRKFLLTAR